MGMILYNIKILGNWDSTLGNQSLRFKFKNSGFLIKILIDGFEIRIKKLYYRDLDLGLR